MAESFATGIDLGAYTAGFNEGLKQISKAMEEFKLEQLMGPVKACDIMFRAYRTSTQKVRVGAYCTVWLNGAKWGGPDSIVAKILYRTWYDFISLRHYTTKIDYEYLVKTPFHNISRLEVNEGREMANNIFRRDLNLY